MGLQHSAVRRYAHMPTSAIHFLTGWISICADPPADQSLEMAPKQKKKQDQATLRVGGALGIIDVLRDFGIDPDEVLREAGIAPRTFDDPDNLITYAARGRMMARAVARTDCQHFGLLVGQRMNLQALGLVGLLARNAPDVEAALRIIVNYLHLHARGAVMQLKVDHTLAMLTYAAYQPNVPATDQTGSAAVAMMVNVMRTLCGPQFRPSKRVFPVAGQTMSDRTASSSRFRFVSTQNTTRCFSQATGWIGRCKARIRN
ncbi:MAG: AraC family transcriptional regulator [Proteobacteria bacterium]|nr:AraC family transcriptional regulator [Pseudomonadota bacterium]